MRWSQRLELATQVAQQRHKAEEQIAKRREVEQDYMQKNTEAGEAQESAEIKLKSS